MKPYFWAVQLTLQHQPRDESGGILVHLQMPKLWACKLPFWGSVWLKMPHHWHMAHSHDRPALPSVIAVTGTLQGIWLAFNGQVFMGLRAQHLPSSSDGMFIYFLVFLGAGKYKPKPLNLIFSFSSVLALHSDVCATDKWVLRHFWLQLLKESPRAPIFQRNHFQSFDFSNLIIHCNN